MTDTPLSLWHDQGPSSPTREVLESRIEADVAIVGGGYTGLWTAYFLLDHDPSLRVVVIEAEYCGFGASGRNGGWVSAKFPGSREKMAAMSGRDAVVAYQHAMFESIDEIGKVAATEGIDCDFQKGGMLLFANNAAQEVRLSNYARYLNEWGYGADAIEMLDADAASARVAMAGARAAMFTPHCASIHPWRLVRGLAEAVERRGGVIYEHSRARVVDSGRVLTERGEVSAPTVLRCIEAFTATLPGGARELAPVYSLMIATQPMDDDWWDGVGLRHGETFSDERHRIIYGQRTVDGRLAFGGRGAPYHFSSSVKPDWEVDSATHRHIRDVLWELFPQLGGAQVTHRWGGAIAIPRDWRVSVDFDPVGGFGHAGGYVGQGVTSSYLAGRTLADLVVGVDTSRVRLPFVGHRWRRWEPEPLRWIGINLGRVLAPAADSIEERTDRPSVLGKVLGKLTGG